jgi:AcrR family transcriptional regulator
MSHSAAREQAILAAAAELVAEVGYERVTVDAIAARSRASKATMYRKWPGKAELVADALRRQAELRSATELADTGSLRGDLLLAVRSMTKSLQGSRSGPSLLTLTDAMQADTTLRDTVRSQIDERSRSDGALICERASARGETVAAARGPAVLGLALGHLFVRTLLAGEPPTDRELQHLVDQSLLPLLTLPIEPKPRRRRSP